MDGVGSVGRVQCGGNASGLALRARMCDGDCGDCVGSFRDTAECFGFMSACEVLTSGPPVSCSAPSTGSSSSATFPLSAIIAIAVCGAFAVIVVVAVMRRRRGSSRGKIASVVSPGCLDPPPPPAAAAATSPPSPWHFFS